MERKYHRLELSLIISVAILLVLFLVAYQTRPYHNQDFINDLQTHGANVSLLGEGNAWRIFYINGTYYNLSGESVQIFDYPTQSQTNYFINQIDSEGYKVGKIQVYWKNPQHFFNKKNMIILYVGNSTNTLSLLESVYGKQFAGTEYTLSKN